MAPRHQGGGVGPWPLRCLMQLCASRWFLLIAVMLCSVFLIFQYDWSLEHGFIPDNIRHRAATVEAASVQLYNMMQPGALVTSTTTTLQQSREEAEEAYRQASQVAKAGGAAPRVVATTTTTTVAANKRSAPSPGEDEVRFSLGEWLRHVATIEQIEVMQVLREWLESTAVEVVQAKLIALMADDDAAKWSTCAVEDETCDCPSGKVRYGHAEKTWLVREGETRLRCSLQVFKTDVAVGLLKQCQCWNPTNWDTGFNDLVDLARVAKQEKPTLQVLPQPAPSPGEQPPPGSIMKRNGQLIEWIRTGASFAQLGVLAKVYKWLETSRSTARIDVALAKVASPSLPERGPCKEGHREENARRCAGHGHYACLASCRRRQTQRPNPVKRAELCSKLDAEELLWSCDPAQRRVPASSNQAHATAQKVLDFSVQGMCANQDLAEYLTVSLDCEFRDQYLRWTKDESEWFEEAYVSYVGGAKDSTYEWQATNMVRSADIFSNRPMVVVVFGAEFIPPLTWHTMPNIIVFRMTPIRRGVSFNFNKIRAMIAIRALVGIQLDTDQLIAAGMDHVFESTRREINGQHPWPMMPVHWMSREGKAPEPYWQYAFHDWTEKRTMRWGHAHPTWSFWALPFLCDLLHERLLASMRYSANLAVWDLPLAVREGTLSVLSSNKKKERSVRYQNFMREDEDMLNVGLWRDNVEKQWCKFDLEPGLYRQGGDMDPRLYYDSKWFPQGIPVLFISMHNTKRFEETDLLLSFLARCDKRVAKLDCGPRRNRRYCREHSSEERDLRRHLLTYSSQMCCCVEPKISTPVYWAGKWFANGSAVPMRLPNIQKDRACLLP